MAFSDFFQRSALRSKVVLGFAIVLAMLVVIATVSVKSTESFVRTAERVADAHQAIEIEERMMRNVVELESASRDFLATGEAWLLERIQASQGALRADLVRLRANVFTDARSGSKLARLGIVLEQYCVLHESAPGLSGGNGRGPDRAKAKNMQEDIRTTLVALQGEERAILAERSRLSSKTGRSTVIAVLAGSGLTILALLLAGALILRDLSARHRAEEALAQEHNLLSSIINAMPNHVYVKDAKGRFILDNTAHREYLGLNDSHSVEGRTVFDYFAPVVAAKFNEDDHRVIATGDSILGQEEPAVPMEGEQRETWLETNKVAIRDTDGKIVGLVGISSDISTRKVNEEKLRHFAAQLERSNSELQNFASVASHDLQEPLRKIQAFGDRLQSRCGAALGEQGLDYLARMQNAAQRMQSLIQDLLKLSRVTSRQQPFAPCDLSEIVRQVLSDLEIAIEQSRAKVEVGTLPIIDADPLHMRQLFQNLIANALKFHRPTEPPEVSISGRVFEMSEPLIGGAKPGDKICQIRISDNGIGFDEKFAEQIFVVFQRLHTREEYAGTGIGLAVCRKITDRHGGSIMAKSAEGQGASFIITLPLKQPNVPVHE